MPAAAMQAYVVAIGKPGRRPTRAERKSNALDLSDDCGLF